MSSQGGGQDTSHCLLMAAQHRLHMQPVKLLPLAVHAGDDDGAAVVQASFPACHSHDTCRG